MATPMQDAPLKDLPFCNTSLTAGQRTDDLVSRLVRNQSINQTLQPAASIRSEKPSAAHTFAACMSMRLETGPAHRADGPPGARRPLARHPRLQLGNHHSAHRERDKTGLKLSLHACRVCHVSCVVSCACGCSGPSACTAC
jgi:hypothetical protein